MRDATMDERNQQPVKTVRNAKPRRSPLAARDIAGGLESWWIWHSLAWQDIRQRYRGSLLGPFWLTLSMAIMITTLGILYSALFHMDIRTYLPFLTVGLLVWTFISSLCIEGCNSFVVAEPIIRQAKMPFSVHVYRTVYRNFIILAHNAVVYLVVVIIFVVPIGWSALLVLPAMGLLILNGVWVCFLFGMIAARFRDIMPIVSSLVQIVMFMTPILWDPSSLGGRHAWLVNGNPFYALIEIVRSPLLGRAVPVSLWEFALATTVFGGLFTFAFFARFRSRIPFWV